jgi:heavy metal sensor kinase
MDGARVRGAAREVFHYTPPGECILVGCDITPELAELRRLAGFLLGAGGGVLLFGLAGGWWLSTRAIRPIRDISATAARIATGDFSQRIPVADTDSELGQLAGVLNSTFARLEAVFEQQARFTSDAAHELRTPVSVMLTQTQGVLTRDRPAAEYRETVEACQRAAQRMRKLIESLLELARLDARQEPMKRERVDLAQTAGDCIDMLGPLAAERRIAIHADLPSTACQGDADRLGQVITNLLTNAIHYNQEGGEVRVIARQENGEATLTVSDTGPGISEAELPHIFERFWRADKSRTGASGRTGLGLAIVKAIVDAHRGSIEVKSQPGKGSSFVVRIPACDHPES